MTDTPKATKKTPKERAELLLKMTKEAKQVEANTGAAACIVICVFEEENEMIIQDAGHFPMPPEQFYNIMLQAHLKGLMKNKSKSRILKPH